MNKMLRCGVALVAAPVWLMSAGALAEIQTFTGQQAFEISRKQTCGTLDDGVTRYGVFEGRAYSRVPGERDRHLFNVLGVNTRQCGTVTDPERGQGFRSVSREVMLYLHPETNDVLDRWENPWSGETVDVVHVANDPVNMREPRFALDASGQPGTVALRRYGEMLFSSAEVPLFYDNPLGGNYQRYVGGTYHAMEIFNSSYHADELLGEVSLSRSYVAWTRVAQWLPWMQMGSRPGVMVINATGTSVFDRGVIPEPLLSVLEDRYPSYFEPPPVDDTRPNETSWTVFKTFIDAKTAE